LFPSKSSVGPRGLFFARHPECMDALEALDTSSLLESLHDPQLVCKIVHKCIIGMVASALARGEALRRSPHSGDWLERL
jgi:hypothetical protein